MTTDTAPADETPWAYCEIPEWTRCDRANMHVSLARIIAAGIDEFRQNLHSYPSTMTSEEWDDTLSKISAGFARFVETDAFAGTDDPHDDELIAFAYAMQMFANHFLDLWD